MAMYVPSSSTSVAYLACTHEILHADTVIRLASLIRRTHSRRYPSKKCMMLRIALGSITKEFDDEELERGSGQEKRIDSAQLGQAIYRDRKMMKT